MIERRARVQAQKRDDRERAEGMNHHRREVCEARQLARRAEEQHGRCSRQHHQCDPARAHDDQQAVEQRVRDVRGEGLPARLAGDIVRPRVEEPQDDARQRQCQNQCAERNVQP